MPNSYNKHDIDEQFTDKAWIDMKSRLDEVLPVKKPFFLNGWLALAALLCLFCVSGYWFTSSNTKLALENINDEIAIESLANKTSKTPSTSADEKTNIQSSLKTSKPNAAFKQPAKNHSITSNQSNKENTQQSPSEKIEQAIFSAKENTKTTNTINTSKLNKLAVSNEKPTLRNNDPIRTVPKNTKTSKTTSAKIKTPLSKKAKSKVVNTKSIEQPKTNPTKFKATTLNKNNNSIEHIKNLITIDGNLRPHPHQHPSPKLIENTLIVNQSSAGKFMSRELITQKNDDEWLHPKTIHYGIKQGLSSDLTSESKIFTGALIDFNFHKRWFVELSPMYQFGAINKTLEAQYDIEIPNTSIKDNDNTTTAEPGELPPMPTTNPAEEVDEPEYIHSKDTILSSLKANGHYVAADLLLGYRIAPKIETLLGISAGRCFSNCPEDIDAGLKEFNALFDSESFFNNWNLSPKIAFRFALKPKLSMETSYAYNLIPTVKEAYQLDSYRTSSANSNSYRSSNFGVAFVYRFN